MPVNRGEGASRDPSPTDVSVPDESLVTAEPSDVELLRSCRRGDAESWGLLVSRYERLVFSVALRNGLSREDAADVTQTSFIALLDGIDGLHDDERLASWLMTVARRQSWRLRQRDGRQQSSPLDQAPAQADTIEPDTIERWEHVAWLHTGLGQLGEPCRQLLTALYLDPAEPSYADIAHRLGRAIGGLGALRARCLARLRSIMEDAA